MDPEQTFLRVHARVSGTLSQLLTPRIRMVLEYIYLSVAVASFALLVVMHTNFVQQPGCSGELAGVQIAEAQLVQIKISSVGLWSQNEAAAQYDLSENQNVGHLTDHMRIPESRDGLAFTALKVLSSWIGSGIKRNKRNFKMWKGDKEFLEHQIETAVSNGIMRTVSEETGIRDHYGQTTRRDTMKESFFHLYNILHMRALSLWESLKQLVRNGHQLWGIAEKNLHKDTFKTLGVFYLDQIDSFIVQWLERSSLANDPIYLYTTEKGFFLLPEGAKSRHNIHTVNVSISAGHTCFGNRWQQLLINKFVGYDTILMNSLLSAPGPGYLYNFQTKEFFHLSYGPEPIDGPAKFGDYFVTKCSVLLMSLFVFFTTTMSVSFTLRETQSRMLKFTVQLQHHARHHLPTFQLIFVHVIESLVFVPIMIGILFFLFEFYDDQLLAFLVLTLVWLCELFTMISVRTPISMQFFPRFFLLYFLIFHIYFFSYAYGFSYLAFSTTAAFMQHLILFFWNRYEVPALQRFMRNRSQLQQQTGVHITSSTILTSTLHIARVDVRSPGIIGHDLSGVQSLPSDPTQAEESTRSEQLGNTASSNTNVQLPESDRQQQDNNPASSLNPFSSLLLGILGGASTDGLVSFFSMFRDLRDQDNVYVEPSQQEGNGHVS